jgi:hypothetical protein
VTKDPADPNRLVVTATFDPGRLSEEYLASAYERLVPAVGCRQSAQRRRKQVEQHTQENNYEDCGSHLRAG